jgi:hypothetical protein
MINELKPYLNMKDSGVAWVGEVPEHWNMRRLRNAVDMRVSNVDKHVRDGEISVRLCNYVRSREFDFMLLNPPYGKSWKSDLERMGGKGGIKDPRFIIEHAGVLFWWKVGFEDRFQHQHRCCHADPIPQGRDTQRPEFAVGLRYEHSSDGVRSVSLLPERKRQFAGCGAAYATTPASQAQPSARRHGRRD